MIRSRKKLIEVALPLEAINVASSREKSIRHGHPSTLHLWWARQPLAVARAVLFSQMVDDPSEYLEDLRSDPVLLRQAEARLRKRRKVWEEARRVYELARGTGVNAPEPGPEPTLDEMLAQQERERLFAIIEQLVLWENTTNESVLQEARGEIWQSWRRACADNAGHPRAAELFDRRQLPAFHDPFAGGGALPLEAQRLGLESHASDLNPVAVLINKAMIEIPPKFAGRPPVNPEARRGGALLERGWRGAQGLAEDVRYYGQWMRDEAEKRIGHLYPRVEVTPEMVAERPDLEPYLGKALSVIAWIWARTVRSPNPAFADVEIPLASTFMLSTKPGKEAYVEPVIEGGGYRFTVKVGKPAGEDAAKSGTKTGRGGNFRCLMSGGAVPVTYIRSEAQAGRMRSRLMAVVVEGRNGRVYLSPQTGMEDVARSARPAWKPDLRVPTPCHDVDRLPMYGMPTWGDAFTSRQLVALTTFSDLVTEARERVTRDAMVGHTGARASGPHSPTERAGGPRTQADDDGKPLAEGGSGATAYGDAVAVYLAFAVDKVADRGSSLGRWDPTPTQSGIINAFSRQALPMTWDYAESNPLGAASGNYSSATALVAKSLAATTSTQTGGSATQEDAAQQMVSSDKLVSTDPPYYDNIGYADLSDFFYVWLRRSLGGVYPAMFSTLSVPKAEELVATPYRHGGKQQAEAFFLDGMTQVMRGLAQQAHAAFPVTIYYAFKQSESDEVDGVTNTGWDTFLAAVIAAGFIVVGTWPMRTVLTNRMIGAGTNALASSIILVCRKRAADAPSTTRRAFVAALKATLPTALANLQRGNIAPVDLAQAAIGPGMAVYTRYSSVLDAQGKPVTVREALALINEVLAESLAEQEGDFDADSRWALAWFEQCGFDEGEFGTADTLARAKNTSVQGLVEAGILVARQGKVRLLRPAELPADWDPTRDNRLTAWEMVHHLVRVLEKEGEVAAADLVARIGARAEVARELCYRLYTLCERAKRSAEALSYNGLVQSWPEISRLAAGKQAAAPVQGTLDIGDEE